MYRLASVENIHTIQYRWPYGPWADPRHEILAQSKHGLARQPQCLGRHGLCLRPCLGRYLSTRAATGTTRLTVGTHAGWHGQDTINGRHAKARWRHVETHLGMFYHVYLYFVYMFVCVIPLNICVCVSNNSKYICIMFVRTLLIFFALKI
jgi:hypothetical protein